MWFWLRNKVFMANWMSCVSKKWVFEGTTRAKIFGRLSGWFRPDFVPMKNQCINSDRHISDISVTNTKFPQGQIPDFPTTLTKYIGIYILNLLQKEPTTYMNALHCRCFSWCSGIASVHDADDPSSSVEQCSFWTEKIWNTLGYTPFE